MVVNDLKDFSPPLTHPSCMFLLIQNAGRLTLQIISGGELPFDSDL